MSTAYMGGGEEMEVLGAKATRLAKAVRREEDRWNDVQAGKNPRGGKNIQYLSINSFCHSVSAGSTRFMATAIFS